MGMKGNRIGRGFLRTVGGKLFLIFMVSIVLFVFVSGYISYVTSKNIIEREVSDTALQAIQQASGKVDLMLNNYEAITMRLVADQQFQQSLADYADPQSTAAVRTQASKSVRQTLEGYALSDPAILSMTIVPFKEQKDVYSIGTGTGASQVDTSVPWVQQVLDRNGKTVWLQPRVEGYIPTTVGISKEPAAAVARSLTNIETGMRDFFAIIEIKNAAIFEMIKDVRISPSSDIIIVDRANVVLNAADPAKLMQRADLALNAGDERAGSMELDDAKGDKQLVVYQYSEKMDWYVAGTAPIEEVVASAKSIQTMTYIIAGSAALLALLIGYCIARWIGNPLRQLRDLMTQGAEGDLAVRTGFKSRDEIGQVGQAFNLMMEQITELVGQTTRSADAVLHTAANLSDASQTTSRSAKEVAAAAEQITHGSIVLAEDAERVSALTSDLGLQLKHVIEANEAMETSAGKVRSVSQRGTAYMEDLIVKTSLTEDITRQMVEGVNRLKESTGAVQQILGLLGGISKQTNILSLNAGIEAARAGAAGKGFMVVAEEIRKLAEQSRQSIDTVGNIVETIQSEIDGTVQALSSAYPIFTEQTHAVRETGEIFSDVQSQMDAFVVRLQRIFDTISQLGQSQQILSDAMHNVSAVSEQSSATSEEVASLSKHQISISDRLVDLSSELNQVSEQLRASLIRFRT
jgi:methyl-accepting chemotaxis protein